MSIVYVAELMCSCEIVRWNFTYLFKVRLHEGNINRWYRGISSGKLTHSLYGTQEKVQHNYYSWLGWNKGELRRNKIIIN